MRWINRRQGTPRRRHQEYLEIGDDEVERLRREQARSDRARPKAERLLVRVARLLYDQLEATKPDEDLRFLRLRWELKRGELALVKAPEKAREWFAKYRGTAVDELVEHEVRSLIAEDTLTAEQVDEIRREWLPAEAEPRDAGVGVKPPELCAATGGSGVARWPSSKQPS